MKAIAIEDNPSAVSVLTSYLEDYPQPIDFLGHATTVTDGLDLIHQTEPDLIFLDIHLGEHEVFSLFNKWQPQAQVHIIFITAYIESDYILRALRQSAVDYLVKPLDREEFFAALDKVFEHESKQKLTDRLASLEQALADIRRKNVNNIKIPFYCLNGSIEYEALYNWVRIYTEDGITRAHFLDGKIRATNRTLKEMEDMLCTDYPFHRISMQTIVNLHHIEQYQPKHRRLMLSNGDQEQVSRRRVSDLLDEMK
ncbi:MAG TPA: LytTR family DNA-binding domain-containing protein [Clostridia bacterium]|nr:LytTR family DNA-binding domain-containing protein [Clostridia bacterium]